MADDSPIPGDPGALTLPEIRQKYKGAYNDVPDWQLAGALYDKHYAGKISEGDFYAKIGYKPTAADVERREHSGDWHIPGARTVQQVGAQMLTGTAATAAGAVAGVKKYFDVAQEDTQKYHMAAGRSFDDAWRQMKDVFHAVQQQYTYGAGGPNNFWAQQNVQPMSQTAQGVAQTINKPISWATEKTADVLRGTAVRGTAAAAEYAGADPETVQRIRGVGSDLSDMVAPFALGGAVGLAGRGIGAGARALRGPAPPAIPPNVLQGARNAGYRIPEGGLPTAAAGGRTRVSEALSRYHEGVNNQLARRQLGLEPQQYTPLGQATRQAGGAPIEVRDLEQLRADHHAAYQQLTGNIDMPAISPHYKAFQDLIQQTARALDPLLARLNPGEQGFLIRDVNTLQQQFLGKRSFDAKALANRMEILRKQWDTVKNIDPATATGPQIREYVLGTVRRNIADQLQEILDWHAQRTNPTVAAQLAGSRKLINDSYLVEDARHPGTGNISAHDLMQLEDSGRTLTGGLKTMADTARHMPHIVQDLDPVQAGLLSPQNLVGAGPLRAFMHKLGIADKWIATVIPAIFEAVAHRAVSLATAKAGALGYGAYGAYKAARAARPALLRMLLGHRYHQKFYPPSRWQQPARAPTQPLGGVARTAAGGALLSEMDQGDLQ